MLEPMHSTQSVRTLNCGGRKGGQKGACALGGTVQGAAFGGAKI